MHESALLFVEEVEPDGKLPFRRIPLHTTRKDDDIFTPYRTVKENEYQNAKQYERNKRCQGSHDFPPSNECLYISDCEVGIFSMEKVSPPVRPMPPVRPSPSQDFLQSIVQQSNAPAGTR
ncbi:MAG: hypothetical protein D8M53_05060 [Armatimonadetes bacterium]|nr:hypothetical protein [Armatimonadota bacterium]